VGGASVAAALSPFRGQITSLMFALGGCFGVKANINAYVRSFGGLLMVRKLLTEVRRFWSAYWLAITVVPVCASAQRRWSVPTGRRAH